MTDPQNHLAARKPATVGLLLTLTLLGVFLYCRRANQRRDQPHPSGLAVHPGPLPDPAQPAGAGTQCPGPASLPRVVGRL